MTFTLSQRHVDAVWTGIVLQLQEISPGKNIRLPCATRSSSLEARSCFHAFSVIIVECIPDVWPMPPSTIPLAVPRSGTHMKNVRLLAALLSTQVGVTPFVFSSSLGHNTKQTGQVVRPVCLCRLQVSLSEAGLHSS